MFNRQDFFNAESALFDNSVQSQAQGRDFGNPDVTTPVDNFYNSGLIFHVGAIADHIPQWSIYPARRDRALRAYYKHEPIIAGAIYSLASRIKSLPYKLSGKDDLRGDISNMLNAADFGRGLGSLLSKTVIDLSTQDNGFFWEVIGTGGKPESDTFSPVGVNYLDPGQCYRTFDPKYPVMYIDPVNGTRHKMHRKTIISGASMAQPNELARGVGFSGISRALKSVQLMRSILEYRYEKASGTFDRGIIYGKGLTIKTLKRLIEESRLNDEADGLSRIGRMPAYVTPTGIELGVLDFASIPDNFDAMSETELYVYTLALAFGVDAREFWSVTQSGATKADASVQNMKARGKGLADIISTIERAITTYLLPDGMTFTFDFVDDERDASVANKNRVVVDTISRAKQEGFITELEGRAQLIHDGVVDSGVLQDASLIADFGDWQEKQVENEQLAAPLLAENAPANDTGSLSDNEVQANNQPLPENNTESDEKGYFLDGSTVWLYSNVKSLNNVKMAQSKVKAIRYVLPSGHYRGVKSKSGYRASLRAIARGAFYGEISFFDTVSAMDSSIRRHFRQAWNEGAALEGISVSELTETERQELDRFVQDEMNYVIPFVEWIITENNSENEGSKPAMFARIDLWVQRYDRVKARARLLAAGNKKLKWVWDELAEHCVDCGRLNGRVYRANTWANWNIEPQSPLLECFGNCRCGFQETDEPANRGRPPRLTGQRIKKGAEKIYKRAYSDMLGTKPDLLSMSGGML